LKLLVVVARAETAVLVILVMRVQAVAVAVAVVIHASQMLPSRQTLPLIYKSAKAVQLPPPMERTPSLTTLMIQEPSATPILLRDNVFVQREGREVLLV
jgi:hypothetical protein